MINSSILNQKNTEINYYESKKIAKQIKKYHQKNGKIL